MNSKLLLIFIFLYIPFSILNAKLKYDQGDLQLISLVHNEQDYLTDFCTHITFTQSGLSSFFRSVYNHHLYTEYFAHNLSHIVQFLMYGKYTKQDHVYIQSCLRLFLNKLKYTKYITAHAIAELLQQFPGLIAQYCQEDESFLQQVHQSLKKLLYSKFLGKFSFFKEKPNEFFSELSQDLVSISFEGFLEHEVDKEQFRQTVVRFLEQSVGKIIWCPLQEKDVWQSFKHISEQLEELMFVDIINEDELDDLYHTLLGRFIHFLDLSGSSLSLDLTNSMKKDIESEQLTLFKLEEQEPFMQTKSSILKQAIAKTEAKIIARQKGIITEVIAY